MKFVNRKKELETLEKIYSSNKAELVLVYGRRRIGKTKLLIESIKNRTNAIYFLCDLSKNLLDILSSQVEEEYVKFTEWDDFFNFILKSKYKIFIIDEFQYAYQINPAFMTQLQRWWEKLKQTDKKIILCGSIISTIHKITKGYNSALYGRLTREIKIEELKFRHLREFFPKENIENLIKIYGVLGGIPRYLEEYSSPFENFIREIFDKTSFLFNEPYNLLLDEFKDISSYLGILYSIASGSTTFSEISSKSRIEITSLPKYLTILELVNIIEKYHPVFGKRSQTRYKIKDKFFRFWFKFILPKKHLIERNIFDFDWNLFNTYLGEIFEEICLEFTVDLLKPKSFGKQWGKIPKKFRKEKTTYEIDIVAYDDSKLVFGECKWKDNVNAKKFCIDLIEKIQYVEIPKELENHKREIWIFAKSFKNKIDQYEGYTVKCFDLEDLESIETSIKS